MARNFKSLLEFEAKRNFMIADVINNIESISFDNIDNLHVKPWIKKALKLLKSEKKSLQYVVNEKDILSNTRFFLSPDPNGRIFEYDGTTRFIRQDRGELELHPGTLYWIPDTGGILYETLFSKYVDPTISGRLLRVATRSEYTNAYKNRLLDKNLISEASYNTDGNLGRYGVRISK